ncbi:5-formyltetrahydrofolate cyclo-ligase [Tranquillimonas rosea]|uniref:5-formyltetrahydrofolate cyclo-ligase n=1 Tax=Tranquillimonas rosea TaxID=641238 RepID=A0A1H9VUP3_9RHOB|nr:5-formyltetrahydrofolate cyclo-ligase [Tranquillimonas rosea]SES25486.1 5-formyltetrahydrofolate cyclo-ligase [Tranquillimonas rosea]
MSGCDDPKAAARKAALARRAEAHRAARGRAGALSSFLAGHRGVPVAGYLPIRSEIDPVPAMAEAAAHGPVAVPVVEAEATPLRFRAWTPDVRLTEGPFGVQVPVEGEWVTPEIVIVPMLAFDRRGGRLGYGGGFYDRTLAALRAQGPVLAVGFAYAGQEMDDLPLEETDAPLDMIVTESGVIDI